MGLERYVPTYHVILYYKLWLCLYSVVGIDDESIYTPLRLRNKQQSPSQIQNLQFVLNINSHCMCDMYQSFCDYRPVYVTA